jgi:hypothetical protein
MDSGNDPQAYNQAVAETLWSTRKRPYCKGGKKQ